MPRSALLVCMAASGGGSCWAIDACNPLPARPPARNCWPQVSEAASRASTLEVEAKAARQAAAEATAGQQTLQDKVK